jgi:hypothetical protein
LEQDQESVVCISRKIQNTGDKKSRLGFVRILCLTIWRPNMVAEGEGKEDAANCQQMGMENTASYLER